MITHYGLFRVEVPSSPFIKTADFFRRQGGLIKDWGKFWEPIADATSIGDARRKFAARHNVKLSSLYDDEE